MDVGTVLSAALQCSEPKEILSAFGHKSQRHDLQATVSTITDMLHEPRLEVFNEPSPHLALIRTVLEVFCKGRTENELGRKRILL